MFDFSAVLNNYSTTLHKVVEPEGSYNQSTGIWEAAGQPELQEISGVIQPLSNNELQFDQGGTYTVHDRKLYTQEALDIGGKVQHEGVNYKVHQSKDYAAHGGFNLYYLKRVGEAK